MKKWLRDRVVETVKERAIFNAGGVINWYTDIHRKDLFGMMKSLKKRVPMELLDNEAYQIVSLVEATQKVPGDIAEIGVYKGGSAKLISTNKGSRHLFLFDTFAGLPGGNESMFNQGDFQGTLDEVKQNLEGVPDVSYHKGLFPSTAGAVEDRRFSFVHIDVDLYEGTKAAVEFFYPRMNKGGIILTHDYTNESTPGVRRAFDEFFKGKPEPIIDLPGSQALIVKTS